MYCLGLLQFSTAIIVLKILLRQLGLVEEFGTGWARLLGAWGAIGDGTAGQR